jgi:hypothetical protein
MLATFSMIVRGRLAPVTLTGRGRRKRADQRAIRMPDASTNEPDRKQASVAHSAPGCGT